jgi:hypothetical protein
MSKIVIGESEGKNLKLDIDLLIPSRLLIQANSGGGKSFLLRRLQEQLYQAKVQTIAIDPEGEFYTLREKFGFVLVGEGGETPADVRSAALLAEKFLDLKVSAVCDLYEAFRSRPMDRRQWVRAFINALLDAPRSMWHPLVVIVDEAHKFCPQETPKAASMIDREIIGGCKEAMIALSTTGRKRGFCPIWATQRLAKVDKDASAEFFNRMVGMTIEDVDVDRAADLMSVSKDEKHEFRTSLRNLNPGEFYCFGRAIATERTLVKVGPVETHHPESGKQAKNAEAPPMPEEVAKFLPQLSDLPKEAENKARSVAELEKTVRDLRSELKKRPTVEKLVHPIVSVPDAILRAVKAATDPLIKQLTVTKQKAKRVADAAGHLCGVANGLQAGIQDLANFEIPHTTSVQAVAPVATQRAPEGRSAEPVRAVATVRTPPVPSGNGDAAVSRAELRIVNRLAELVACTGSENVRKEQLAAWCELAPTSGGFRNYLGSLRSAGLIDYPQPGFVALTDTGRAAAAPGDTPTTSSEMLERAKRVLGGTEARMLDALHNERAAMDKAFLASQIGLEPTSGGFRNYLGHMRTLGFVHYPAPGQVQAADWLFL